MYDLSICYKDEEMVQKIHYTWELCDYGWDELSFGSLLHEIGNFQDKAKEMHTVCEITDDHYRDVLDELMRLKIFIQSVLFLITMPKKIRQKASNVVKVRIEILNLLLFDMPKHD